jgi:hypothetical protein
MDLKRMVAALLMKFKSNLTPSLSMKDSSPLSSPQGKREAKVLDWIENHRFSPPLAEGFSFAGATAVFSL